MGKNRIVCIPAVYQKIAGFGGDLSFPKHITEAPETSASSAPNCGNAAAVFMSPVKASGASRCATPQSSAKFENVLGSPLRSGAKRVAVSVAPSPMRGMCATPGRRGREQTRVTVTATPAVTDAVVSAEAKTVILSLLRPVASQRIAAKELLESTWMKSAE